MLDTTLDMLNKTNTSTHRLTMGTKQEVLNVRLAFFSVAMKLLRLISDENDFKEDNTAKFDNMIHVLSLIIQYHDDYTVKDRAKLMGMEMYELKSILKEVREEQGIGDKKPMGKCNAINLSSDFEKEKQKQAVKDETKNKRDVSDLANYITPAKKSQPELKLLYLQKKNGF